MNEVKATLESIRNLTIKELDVGIVKLRKHGYYRFRNLTKKMRNNIVDDVLLTKDPLKFNTFKNSIHIRAVDTRAF